MTTMDFLINYVDANIAYPVNGSGVTWTRTGAIVTITKISHGLITDNIITVTISSDVTALLLGTKIVTKLTDDTFSVVGLNAGAASGTCTYKVTIGQNYITLDLSNDYLIWSKTLADLMTHEPTPDELNVAAEIIDPSIAVIVAKCLLMDYSHDVGGSYYTHLVKGMGENKRFVYCFSFDGATATEPQLEAWDTSTHTTYVKNVLGLGTPANSMMQAKCTTTSLPGTADFPVIAGAANVCLLNDGAGALSVAKDLYANMKIKIPAAYSTPAAETFVLTCRYTYF